MKFPSLSVGLRGLLFGLAACATATPGQPAIGDDEPAPDAAPDDDDDDPVPDAGVDEPDAGGGTSCTPTQTNLLTNGSFDATPIGTGWTETPIDAAYPLITALGTLVQSAPNKAWLGGITQASANDAMYQELTIPADATALALTGYYEIRSTEFFTIPLDLVTVTLETPTGTVLHTALSLHNGSRTTAWTAINVTFPQAYAGQTVRLRLASSNDTSYATSFYFDSLALNATTCP